VICRRYWKNIKICKRRKKYDVILCYNAKRDN
jgi:hypothetical protein